MASTTAPRAFSRFICRSCRQRHLQASRSQQRSFGSTPIRPAEPSTPSDSNIQGEGVGKLGALSLKMEPNASRRIGPESAFPTSSFTRSSLSSALNSPAGDLSLLTGAFGENLQAHAAEKPHRLHVFATKHNTHITFVQPERPASETLRAGARGKTVNAKDQNKMVDVLLSLSTGNIGFRKAGRGSYDAAYQLAAYTLKQLQERGLWKDVSKLEIVLRGFGAGREAVTKVLLGSEGRFVRNRISAVMDATRLKQGGPRGKKPRRLG